MNLYSTILFIDHYPVRYNVSWQQGNQFLLFKPELPQRGNNDYPIFWVSKQNGVWTPINVQDPSLVSQVTEDILQHLVEQAWRQDEYLPIPSAYTYHFYKNNIKEAYQKWQAVIASRKLQRIKRNEVKEINSSNSAQPCFHGIFIPLRPGT